MIQKFINRFLLIALLALGISNSLYAQKFADLAQTPPMGWNSWNTFQTKISEPMLRSMVDNFISSGMKDAGYTYFVLDDGWMSMQRDKNGNLVPDSQKFPNGIKEFVDYVHSKGLKFGIYNCAGTKTCAGYPGTRGYEYQDARLYASWGVDYLKYDWCNTEGIDAKEAYTLMSQAIKEAGRPMIFSICEWGQHQPWRWGKDLGQLWRTTGDIYAGFDKNLTNGGWTALSVLNILDKQDSIRQYAGPGHWNDPDMLEVGNGMTYSEDKAHFSIWCMLAAPLMAGNDLSKMSAQTKSILTDKEMIAIDQDSLGVEAFKYTMIDSVEVLVKPLAHNEFAICFLNRSGHSQALNFDWKKQVINDSITKNSYAFDHFVYKTHNVWTNKDGNTAKPLVENISAHDVVVLKLKLIRR